MAGKNKKKKEADSGVTVARNRRARHEYDIEETLEAGIVLIGSEVKSLRQGRASINEAYATDQSGELFLFNAHIPEYAAARHFGHAPKRQRKLLVHKRERDKLIGAVRREGMTLVPLSIFFNRRGIAKVSLALARGRRKADKRAAIKDREWKRQKERLLRDRS